MRRFENNWQRMQFWDEDWCLRLNSASAVPWVCVFFRVISRLGDGLIWYALMAALLAADGDNALEPVLCMFITGAAGLAIYKALKKSTSRPRPYQVKTQIRLGADPLDRFSFPSGHTLHAVSLSLVAVSYYPFLATLLVPFTLLVAASRVILGLHYPSDVLAGAVLGVSIALGVIILV